MNDGQNSKNKSLSGLVNYFLHGLVIFGISYLMYLMQSIQYYSFTTGFMLFNLIVNVLLLVPLGIINTIISETIWRLNLRSNAEIWLAQGFLIAIPTQALLLPFNPLVQLLMDNASFMTMISFLILLIAYLIIFGTIGRLAANPFTDKNTVTQKSLSFMTTRAKCPNCGESFKYSNQDISDEKTVTCRNCKKPFAIEPNEILMKRITDDQQMGARIDL